jgi:hypothetical protein
MNTNIETTTKSMDFYLAMDGNIGFNLAIYNRFSSIGDSVYSEICGGFIDGVYQWAIHNIDDVMECKNHKYTGWEITFGTSTFFTKRRVYIPNWVMNITPKDWKHAKSLFNKFLLEDVAFNNEQRLNGN